MSYASYSEDILKKHESDVFDLLRELEAGGVSELRQQGALPEFESLVKQLGSLLSDPAQPAAMRLLDLRQEQANLSFDLARSKDKARELGAKNQALNRENIWLKNELRKTRGQAEGLKNRAKNDLAASDSRLAAITAQRDLLQNELNELKRKITNLEKMALEAQVDRRY